MYAVLTHFPVLSHRDFRLQGKVYIESTIWLNYSDGNQGFHDGHQEPMELEPSDLVSSSLPMFSPAQSLSSEIICGCATADTSTAAEIARNLASGTQ